MLSLQSRLRKIAFVIVFTVTVWLAFSLVSSWAYSSCQQGDCLSAVGLLTRNPYCALDPSCANWTGSEPSKPGAGFARHEYTAQNDVGGLALPNYLAFLAVAGLCLAFYKGARMRLKRSFASGVVVAIVWCLLESWRWLAPIDWANSDANFFVWSLATPIVTISSVIALGFGGARLRGRIRSRRIA